LQQHELHIAVGSHATLAATLVLQTLTVLYASNVTAGLVLVGLQWLVMFQATAGLLHRWVLPSLYSVCLYYLSTIGAFGGTYYVCSVLDSSAFSFDRPLLRDETAEDPSTLYFLSVSVQTLVGFGAVTAATYTTRSLVMVQQLAGLAYHAGIIAQALAKIKDAAVSAGDAEAAESAAAALDGAGEGVGGWTPVRVPRLTTPRGLSTAEATPAPRTRARLVGGATRDPPARRDSVSTEGSIQAGDGDDDDEAAAADGGIEGGPDVAPRTPPVPSGVPPARSCAGACFACVPWSLLLLPLVVALQGLHFGLLFVLGGSDVFALQERDLGLLLVSCAIQLLVVAVVIASAFRAARATVQRAGRQLTRLGEAEPAPVSPFHALSPTAPGTPGAGAEAGEAGADQRSGPLGAGLRTAWVLVQAYVSSILLFGGLYVSVFLAAPEQRPFSLRCGDVCLGMPDSSGRGPALASVTFWEVVTEMVYLASASLTGNGDGSVYPTRWWSRLAVALSMLSGVLFNVVILAMGSSALQDMSRIQDVVDDREAARRERRRRHRHRSRRRAARQAEPRA